MRTSAGLAAGDDDFQNFIDLGRGGFDLDRLLIPVALEAQLLPPLRGLGNRRAVSVGVFLACFTRLLF